jgi:hypothetical protein
MLRATTLLIVTMLTGPAGPLGCDLWCISSGAENQHRAVGCHDGPDSESTGRRLASTTRCHDVAAIAPFIAAGRQTAAAPIATAAAAVFDTRSTAGDNDDAAAGRRVFDVQPPRPPSRRPILRV